MEIWNCETVEVFLNRIMSIFGMAPRNWYLTTWQMLAVCVIYIVGRYWV